MTLQLEISGEVSVESGIIGVGDKNLVPSMDGYSEIELLKNINSGNIFYFDTGGDGTFGINIYLVDSLESEVDSSFDVIFRSKSAIIKVPSGTVRCADLGEMKSNNNGIEQTVDPGNYELVVSLVESHKQKFFGYLIYLMKTKSEAVNKLSEVETLG